MTQRGTLPAVPTHSMHPINSVTADWRPSAALDALRLRAGMLAAIRTFFAVRGVMEVETPLLSSAGTTDAQLESFASRYRGPGAPRGRALWLHTSPEFAMKRLLAAGSGPIYQLCKAFRQGEFGARHNPEFTLLEWYRPGWDQHRLMDEVERLAGGILGGGYAAHPAQRLSYADAFLRHVGLDPHRAPETALREAAQCLGIAAVPGLEGRDPWLDLLLTHLVEPHLGRGLLTFLYDYPASQAALARVDPGEPATARRFELYCEGVELANGFHELGDAVEQGRRFAAEREARRNLGLDDVPEDRRLVAALEAGLPDCAGVALGVDRLVMLAAGAANIDQVIAFPLDRA